MRGFGIQDQKNGKVGNNRRSIPNVGIKIKRVKQEKKMRNQGSQ